MAAIVGSAGAFPDAPALALLPGGQLASVSRRDTTGYAMQIKHRGLRALHERGDGSRLSADMIPRLLPASRRCHTASARNAALCPTLLPQRAARSCPAPCSLKSKKAASFSDFAGSGVDTHWAVQFGAVPDPPGFRLGRCLARALSAATQELTRKAPNQHPAAPRAVTGRPKSGCTIGSSWNPTRPSLHARRRRQWGSSRR